MDACSQNILMTLPTAAISGIVRGYDTSELGNAINSIKDLIFGLDTNRP